jgi:ABC-type multidrug transport system fused ATPase/permease subunit
MANLRGGLPVATADPDWLIDGNSLPSSKRFVPRKTIEMGIVDRIQQFGACIVVGASGLGKSSVALLLLGIWPMHS